MNCFLLRPPRSCNWILWGCFTAGEAGERKYREEQGRRRSEEGKGVTEEKKGGGRPTTSNNQARQRLSSSTRNDLVVTNSKFREKSFFFTAPRLWNRLPLTVCRKESTDSFKMALKTFLHSDADVLDT